MLLKSLDDILVGAAPGVGRRWLSKLRKAENTSAFGSLDEGELLSIHGEIIRKLGRWFDKSADKNEIGAFFVMMGKEYCAQSIPLSELTFALNLDRKAVTEHIVEGEDLEGAHRIYALMEVLDEVGDFFFLGAYYITKGYLEDTFMRLRNEQRIDDETLNKYLPDNFFFKDR
jgi:hypothetical protein